MHTTQHTMNMLHGIFLSTTTKQAQVKCFVYTSFTNGYYAKTSSILYRAGVSALQMANTHLFLFHWQERKKKNLPEHTNLGARISSGTKIHLSLCGITSKEHHCITLISASCLTVPEQICCKIICINPTRLLGSQSIHGGNHTYKLNCGLMLLFAICDRGKVIKM